MQQGHKNYATPDLLTKQIVSNSDEHPEYHLTFVVGQSNYLQDCVCFTIPGVGALGALQGDALLHDFAVDGHVLILT